VKSKYKLQVLQWQMHLLRAGGAICAYTPIEPVFFATEADARAAFPHFQQMYGNPPQTYAQLLVIETPDSGEPFMERARLLYEQPGPRNGPQNCKIMHPEWG
jgi:hypothetical protein